MVDGKDDGDEHDDDDMTMVKMMVKMTTIYKICCYLLK